jgi:tetraacyldisaccharide 4'-kinase
MSEPITQRLSEWVQSVWYEKRPIALLFLPLSAIFYAIVVVRRLLYKIGFKKSTRLTAPVIIIGNITVGGTGKTPFTIWLAQELKKKGYRPGIISRGYGGQASSWPQQVRPDSDPRTVGDEALIISRATHCPMAVGPDRAAAAQALLEHTECDIILSDDGLQHYALQRTIEIVVVDGVRRLGNGFCLPAGPLREPMRRLNSVDLIVVNGVASKGEVGMHLEGAVAVNLKDETITRPLQSFKKERVVAVAGIGNPARFFNFLKRAGLEIEEKSFPDHHQFLQQDLDFSEQSTVLMTEKDAVKCKRFATGQEWYVPVEAVLSSHASERISELLEQSFS